MSFLDRLLAWLKEGWPAGIPEADVVPLLAVLSRRLSDDEVRDVAQRLADQGMMPPTRIDVAAEMLRLTHEIPTPEQADRVLARLWGELDAAATVEG